MDPASTWHELFRRLSKEITVIPLSQSQVCDQNRVEYEFLRHVINPSEVSQRLLEESKPSDSTGATVMSLPLVFPLDPPSGTYSMPRHPIENSLHFASQNHTGLVNMCTSSARDCPETPVANSGHASRPKKTKSTSENRSAPRANVYVDNDGKTIFSCTKCCLTFDSAMQFQEHWKTHVSDRPFICHECGMALKRKEHLDRHRSAHTSDRPHECPHCVKKFKRLEHLTRHIITHAEVKPFICPLCNKGFSRKDHLAKHSATHCLRKEAEEEQRRYYTEMQSWDHSVVQKLGLDHSPVLQEFQEMIGTESANNRLTVKTEEES